MKQFKWLLLPISILFIECRGLNQDKLIDGKNVSSIEVHNGTYNDKIPGNAVFTDPEIISNIVGEFNNMKQIGEESARDRGKRLTRSKLIGAGLMQHETNTCSRLCYSWRG